MELSQYDLTFEARRVIKGQSLADFFAENANSPVDLATIPASRNLYVDGSSTNDGSRAGLIVETTQATSMNTP